MSDEVWLVEALVDAFFVSSCVCDHGSRSQIHTRANRKHALLSTRRSLTFYAKLARSVRSSPIRSSSLFSSSLRHLTSLFSISFFNLICPSIVVFVDLSIHRCFISTLLPNIQQFNKEINGSRKRKQMAKTPTDQRSTHWTSSEDCFSRSKCSHASNYVI